MNRARWSALLDAATYAALTALVWGANAFQRGLWQDDVQALGEAFRRLTRSFHALFAPDASPLRRLTLVPSAIAWATPYPIETLHVLCASVWFAQAVLAGWIVHLLLPGRRWTQFAVVCLTLTATSDFTTGSIVALAYNVAALFLLAATGCALFWMDRGRIVALVSSAILLTYSLLTMEVALPAAPFLAFLFVWYGRRRSASRVAGLLTAWGVVLVPVIVLAWSFMRDPKSYAAEALVPMSRHDLALRTIALWRENFAPWRWAFMRHDWFARPPAVISSAWMAAGAIFAAALFFLRAQTKHDEATDEELRRSIFLAGLFVMMALAANAAYAGVWYSEIRYRMQILSRIWASMAIGVIAGWAGVRRRRLRWTSFAVVTAFVFFGTWGAIERQDFFLASWREHQRELASILDAVPAVRTGTAVMLRGTPPPTRYIATEADYLTTHWLRLLYNDSNLPTFRLDPHRGATCQPTAIGLACVPEGQEISYDNKKRERFFRFDVLVVLDYDQTSGSWRLLRSLQSDPLARGHEAEAERYRPSDRIIERPLTLRQRRLLLR